MPGYRSAVSSFEVPAGGTPPAIELALTPLAAFAQVSADMPDGVVSLNGKAIGNLQGGTLDLNDLAPGANTLEFASGAFRGIIQFENAPAAAPKLLGPVRTQGLKAVVVAGVGGQARVHSTITGAELTVDGKPSGEVPSGGLALENLGEGSHELVLSAPGEEPHKFIYESGAAPSLIASMFSNANLGSLRVATGVDNVTVILNGERYKRPTQRGRLLIFLPPKKYTVRVEKEGFLTPPDQVVELKRAEEARVDFVLQPAPQKATLAIRNGEPGADVLVDNSKLGSVGPDGAF